MNFGFSWMYFSWSPFGLIPFSECCLFKALELHLSPAGVWAHFVGSSSDNSQTGPGPGSPHQYINILSTLFKEITHMIYYGSQEVSGDLGVKLHGNVKSKLGLCLDVPRCCCLCWEHGNLSLGCSNWAAVTGVRAWTAQTQGLALFHSPDEPFFFVHLGKSFI